MSTRVNTLHNNLKYRLVPLHSTKDIVDCSFIVRNSLNYLNLELCQACVFHEIRNYTLSYHSVAVQYDDGFVTTEEDCRKKFDRNRYSLLYKLHLDIPMSRNINLKQGPGHDMLTILDQFPVGKLSISKEFDLKVLESLVQYVFELTRDRGYKLRVIKWLLSLDLEKESKCGLLSVDMMDYFVDLLYPTFVDSEVIKQFLRKCNLAGWIEACDSPFLLEEVLYYVHLYGRRRSSDKALPNMCIFLSNLYNVDPLLKYRFSASFCYRTYRLYMNEVLFHGRSMGLTREAILQPESWMGKKRYFLLLQVMLIRFRKLHHSKIASEVLRLLWSTFPDAFLTLDEITRAFGDVFHPELINDIHTFYAQSVGGVPEVAQPRALKHYCRTKIRKVLWGNRKWLPEGIEGTGLPTQLKDYLNLVDPKRRTVSDITCLKSEDENGIVCYTISC